MCGRFAQAYDDTALLKKFGIEDLTERIQPKFNLSPGNQVNTVLKKDNHLKLSSMPWGFSALHGKPLPSLIINSSLDTLISNSHLGKYLVKHRCIIPVSGFYEWHNKQPYFIKCSTDILCLAGVFVHDENGYKCSVTTIDSAGFLKNIHHRMPLLLNDELVKLWLSSGDIEDNLLKAEADKIVETLDFHKVTPAVNDTNFELEECIEPLQENCLFFI